MLLGTRWRRSRFSRATRPCSTRSTRRLRRPVVLYGRDAADLGTWVVATESSERHLVPQSEPGAPVRCVVFCAAATFVMWIIATLGVVRRWLARSRGRSAGPGHRRLADTHALLVLRPSAGLLLDHGRLPDLVQRHSDRYGGNIFSDSLTRLAFLMLILLSTPVGIHHHSWSRHLAGWKWLHTLTTYGVACLPS